MDIENSDSLKPPTQENVTIAPRRGKETLILVTERDRKKVKEIQDMMNDHIRMNTSGGRTTFVSLQSQSNYSKAENILQGLKDCLMEEGDYMEEEESNSVAPIFQKSAPSNEYFLEDLNERASSNHKNSNTAISKTTTRVGNEFIRKRNTTEERKTTKIVDDIKPRATQTTGKRRKLMEEWEKTPVDISIGVQNYTVVEDHINNHVKESMTLTGKRTMGALRVDKPRLKQGEQDILSPNDDLTNDMAKLAFMGSNWIGDDLGIKDWASTISIMNKNHGATSNQKKKKKKSSEDTLPDTVPPLMRREDLRQFMRTPIKEIGERPCSEGIKCAAITVAIWLAENKLSVDIETSKTQGRGGFITDPSAASAFDNSIDCNNDEVKRRLLQEIKSRVISDSHIPREFLLPEHMQKVEVNKALNPNDPSKYMIGIEQRCCILCNRLKTNRLAVGFASGVLEEYYGQRPVTVHDHGYYFGEPGEYSHKVALSLCVKFYGLKTGFIRFDADHYVMGKRRVKYYDTNGNPVVKEVVCWNEKQEIVHLDDNKRKGN